MSDFNFVKSPLLYMGNKYKLLPQIYPLFPNFEKEGIVEFYDLFCGGGDVTANLALINQNNQNFKIYTNDLSYEMIYLLSFFYKEKNDNVVCLIEELLKKFNLSEKNLKEDYLFLRDSYNQLKKINKSLNTTKQIWNLTNIKNSDENEKIIDFLKNGENSNLLNNLPLNDIENIMLYLLIRTSFSNSVRFNNKGEFNVSHGYDRGGFPLTIKEKLIEFLNTFKRNKIIFSNKSYLNFKNKILNSKNKKFVYLDPPYYITDANYNNNWKEEQEKEFLIFCDSLIENNVKFAISNVIEHKDKENLILKEWIKRNEDNLNIHYLNFNYSNSNYQTSRKPSKEILITNY